jgi:hypothetical protein
MPQYRLCRRYWPAEAPAGPEVEAPMADEAGTPLFDIHFLCFFTCFSTGGEYEFTALASFIEGG